MNIVLFGFKNSGKTTIGQLLAEKRELPFVDVDRLIEGIYQEKTGEKLPVHKVFETLGASGFRAIEKEAVFSTTNKTDSIIATGGGSVLDSENVEILKSNGQLIYLKAPKKVIKERMLSSERLPAFLDPNDKEGSFERMYVERESIYEKIADIVIETEGKENEDVIKEILNKTISGQYGE